MERPQTSEVGTQTEQPPQERYGTRYYRTRYETDMKFRNEELARCGERVKRNYHNNPEKRQKMIENAKARYYRLKEERSRLNQ